MPQSGPKDVEGLFINISFGACLSITKTRFETSLHSLFCGLVFFLQVFLLKILKILKLVQREY